MVFSELLGCECTKIWVNKTQFLLPILLSKAVPFASLRNWVSGYDLNNTHWTHLYNCLQCRDNLQQELNLLLEIANLGKDLVSRMANFITHILGSGSMRVINE